MSDTDTRRYVTNRCCRQVRTIGGLLGIALAMTLTPGLVPTASAAQPTRIPQEPLTTDVPIQGACSFDVVLHPLRGNQTVTIFSNKQGEQTSVGIHGPLAVQLTNASTGKSIDLNVPGPGKIDLQAGEATLTGPWLLAFDKQFGLPSDLVLTVGHWTFSVTVTDPSTFGFVITGLLGGSGTVQDLCASLS